VRLIGCPAASLADVCREHAPSHVLTFASPGKPIPETPRGIVRRHLAFNDIAEPRPGLSPPSVEDAQRIIGFGRSWDGARPLVVSCEVGVSRSTAALFAIACDRHPDLAESVLADRLRTAAPCATPNPLLVSLADRILGRQDRMIRAIAAIGRGADYEPYRFFELPHPAAG
jgi:predicted protein tyrosine phosphatase